jgi:hypothetical protein
MHKHISYLISLICVFSIALIVSIRCSPKEKVDPAKLIGIWNKMPDSSSQSFYNGKNCINYVLGHKQAAFDYEVMDNALIKTDRSNGEKYQYTIVKLTEDSLCLRHISSGTQLSFWRSKSSVIVQRRN